MDPVHIYMLAAIFQLSLEWNKARCFCLAQMIIGIFNTRTVNLSILSEAFAGNA